MIGDSYFDNAATTKPFKEVVERVAFVLNECYGNPSSLHKKGVEAEKVLTDARSVIAASLNANPKEIYFTSGGTEANNIAIVGAVRALSRKGNHIVTSTIEHASVKNVLAQMEKEGWRVSYINVNKNGLVDLDELKKAISQETVMVSIMHINNEIGVVQPLSTIKEIINKKNKSTLFHVDAVQSYCKLNVNVKAIGVDLITISSHKIHGTKGCGAIFVRDKVKVLPLMVGGNQEKGLRSGTENVPAIAGFAKAVEMVQGDIGNNHNKVLFLKNSFEELLLKNIENITVNGICNCEDKNLFSPYILNVSFDGVRGETLLHMLAEKNIFVSTGSACSTNKPTPSHVLKAIGVDRSGIEGAIRFSFSPFNTLEQLEYVVDEAEKAVSFLRKYTRK